MDIQTVEMHWTLAILNLLFLQSTYGINVGVGTNDITGPAADIGTMQGVTLNSSTPLLLFLLHSDFFCIFHYSRREEKVGDYDPLV